MNSPLPPTEYSPTRPDAPGAEAQIEPPARRLERTLGLGLRGRLYLLLAVTSLPVVLLVALSLFAEWREDRELADAIVRNSAAQAVDAFARHQRAAHTLLDVVAAAGLDSGQTADAARLARVLATQPDAIRFIALADREGEWSLLRRDAASPAQLAPSAYLPAVPAVSAAPAQGAAREPALYGPVSDPIDGQPTLLASRGTLIVGTQIDALMRILETASRLPGARVTLLFPPHADATRAQLDTVQRVRRVGLKEDSLRVSQLIPGQTLRLQLEVPASAANQPGDLHASAAFLLPMLLALLLGTVLGVRLARTHHAEVRRLRDQVNAFAADDTAQRESLRLPGELGELDDAFQRMANKIEAQRDELRAERELYLRLSRGAADWVWEQDADFRFTRFQFLVEDSYFHMAPQSVLGKTRWELGYENMTPAMWQEHIALLKAHKPFRNLILQRRNHDGSLHVVRASGDPQFDAAGRFTGYKGSGADITRAFQAETAVEMAEQRWVAALESAGHGVWDWDVRENRIFRSRTWGRMLGIEDSAELQDIDLWLRLVHPEDRERTEAAVRDHIEGRVPRYFSEFRLRHADGSWRWMLDRGMAIEFNPDGSPSRIIGTQTDITHEKQTALALSASEARLRIILDHAPNMAIQGFDSAGQVTYWNKPAERIFGWSTEEALGRTLGELFLTPEQGAQFKRELDEVAATGRVIGPDETLVHDKHGAERWILSNLFAIPAAADGTRFICMDVDITATKRAEIRRAESEEQLASIFLNAAMPTLIVDFDTREIFRANRAFERVLEIPATEAVGRTLKEFGVWEDPATPEQFYAEMSRQGRVSGMEVKMRTPSGRQIDMLLFADVITLSGRKAVIAQGLDITEQKRAREKLDEATRWARALVDYSPSVMMMSRRSDGVIVEANDRACELLGYSREEMIGITSEKLGHWADPQQRLEALEALTAKGSLKDFPVVVRTKSGQLRELTLYCEVIVLEGEQYVLSQAIDVSELVRTQQALAESEQRMKTIFTHGPVPMVLSEVESQAIIQVNPALENVLGLKGEDLVGKSLFELGIWANLDDRQRMYETLEKYGRVEKLETRFRTPKGELLDYQISVEIIPYGGRRAIIAHGFDVTANRRALDEAERSRRWFRTLFDQSPISMTILDLEGRTIMANAACSRMYGMPLEQIIGRTSGQNDLWANPGDREQFWKSLQESGSIRDVVLARKRADGRTLHVLAYMDKFEIDGQSYYITQGIDVTRAQESERALRALTALNSAAFNAVGESIIVHDHAGEVILVNAMAERVFGTTGMAPLGATLLEPAFRWCALDGTLADPDSLPFRVARETGKPIREQVIGLQLPLTAAQLDTRWFSVSCEPIDQDGDGAFEGTVTSFFDITDRVRAEAELRVLLDRLQLQLERMPIACFLTDEAFNVSYWNPASARMFGYTPQDILGRSADILTPEDMRPVVNAALRGTLANAAGVDFRTENLTRDGKRITCEWRSNPLFGTDGKFVATMHMAIDMSAVIESQRRLERLNEELEQRVAERTEALSHTVRELEQFSYTVAHDLRAPLRALDGYSSLLAEGGPESSLFLTKVRANVAHMTGLIDGLLNYGRIGRQALHRQAVNMNRLCEVVVADLKHTYPDAQIEVGPMAGVLGDENLLRQVWTNLVSNACKFSSHQPDSRVRLWCEPVGDAATRFHVQDNGVGFDMKYAGKLFGVFERLHRQDEFTGSGIGLSIVKRIIERHGGTVGVDSETGKGSTFWFQLPVQPPAAAPAPLSSSQPAPRG